MRVDRWSVWVDVNQCVACQEWLGLGPANDTGEHSAAVALEKETLLMWLDLAPYPVSNLPCACDGCQKRHLANAIYETGVSN